MDCSLTEVKRNNAKQNRHSKQRPLVGGGIRGGTEINKIRLITGNSKQVQRPLHGIRYAEQGSIWKRAANLNSLSQRVHLKVSSLLKYQNQKLNLI